jgi:hypothetical protein
MRNSMIRGTAVALTLAALLGARATAADAPKVSIALGKRQATATPQRSGCAKTAGGNIDVQQPTPDTVVVTMTGVAVATAHPHGSDAAIVFDLLQCFSVSFDDPKVKKAKIEIEGRVIGVLRSGCKGGSARVGDGCASIQISGNALGSLTIPGAGVSGGENLSVNTKEGPCSFPISKGDYTLHQCWSVEASHPRGLCGSAASAEFAPDAIDPLWISAKEPFKGIAKKDFGFVVTIKVVPAD